MKANCVECQEKGLNLPAEFVLLDEVVNQLKPLCKQHLDEHLIMFGEDMTDYCHISNDAEIVRLANAKLKFLTEQYTNFATAKLEPTCIDCRTRNRISPYLFGFWICDRCRIKRAIKIHEEFLERKTWIKKERWLLEETLNQLKRQLAQLSEKEN